MPINADKPQQWKADVAQSISRYNDWMGREAPRAYRELRLRTAARVEAVLAATAQLTHITPAALRQDPGMLSILRATTTPPLSRERLCGLAQVPVALVTEMERDGRVPPHLIEAVVNDDLRRIGAVLAQLADRDIFAWLEQGAPLTQAQIRRAAMIVADRLCLASAESAVRDAHAQAQRTIIVRWLQGHGYQRAADARQLGLGHLTPGAFAEPLHLPILPATRGGQGTIQADVAVMSTHAAPGDLPVMILARAFADVARAHKKRIEDAGILAALRRTYGDGVRVVVFLGGHVDSAYLGAMAAEGVDWVWEHRAEDMAHLDGTVWRTDERVRLQPAIPLPLHPLVAGSVR